ncbi:MAG: polysaccharide biosynthesis protein [Nitrospinae bacterium]|nr:polysaccharide biosynthesis protein [Nitrospinota bacterium]
MSSFQKFIANIGWTTLGKTGVQIILFLVSILLTRYLGKERLGDYATLLVVPVFIRLLTSFGFETLINKKLPELGIQDSSGGEGRYLISRLLFFRFVTSSVFCFLIYHFLSYYLDFIDKPGLIEFRWALIFYFFVITVDSILSTLFMTLLRFKTLAKTETLGAFLNLVFLLLFIRLEYGIYAVLYAYIISVAMTSVIYLVLARDQYLGPEKKPEWDDMGHLAWVSYGIGFLGFGLMTQSDVLLMNYFRVGRADIGLYHLVTGLAVAMAFLLAGVAPMALSLFSETYAKEGMKSLGSLYCQIVGFAAYLTIPVYVFCVLNSSHLIEFIYGSAFLEGAGALRIYATFAGIQTALGINFTVSTLYVIRHRDVAMRSTAESSILNIALNLVLIPSFGMMGAIMATGLSMVYMVVRQLIAISAEMEIAPVFSVIGRCFLFCLIASVPSLILTGLDKGHLMINLPVYLLAFVLLLVYVKPFNDEQRQLLTNVYPKLDLWAKWFFRPSGN